MRASDGLDELTQLRALLASALGVRVGSNAAMLAQVRELRAEHDELRWLHAEAVWQQERIYVEAEWQLVESEESRFRWAEEAAEMQAKLDLPCGSCHPCTNYSDETWRAASRKPPHVHQWDEARALLAAYRAPSRRAINAASAANRRARLRDG